jgi:hypothetical protein
MYITYKILIIFNNDKTLLPLAPTPCTSPRRGPGRGGPSYLSLSRPPEGVVHRPAEGG